MYEFSGHSISSFFIETAKLLSRFSVSIEEYSQVLSVCPKFPKVKNLKDEVKF
jgi:hypothetical protein